MPASIQLERLRVVLVNTRNPLNIGAAARAMSNFGFAHLRLVNPFEPGFREARSAVGASSNILANATEHGTIADALADCTLVVGTTAGRDRQLNHPLRRLETGARLIRKHLQASNVALVFGSEKRGLLNEHISYCNWLMHIPTREQQLAMNLGQAVALCLYELVRDGRASDGSFLQKPASAADVDRLAELLLEALHESGFVNPRTATSTEQKIRRMVRRLNVPASDADVWLGMVRQILWKLRTPGSKTSNQR